MVTATMQTLLSAPRQSKRTSFRWLPCELAGLAVQALREEALLTPKPGLIDQRGSGSHHDMTLGLMLTSAATLGPWFQSMAEAANGKCASIKLREELGALGREAEANMLCATDGVNTHRGAIWAMGLLVAGCAAVGTDGSIDEVVAFAAALAAISDRFAGAAKSHGAEVRLRFQTGGAKQEACDGFPHVLLYGLPALHAARRTGATENEARILSLLAIMATLDDTCLLYRAGPKLLFSTKVIAARAHKYGGTRTPHGLVCMDKLDRLLRLAWASPGGSADLLAATLFLDSYSLASTTNVIGPERSIRCRN